VDVLKRTNQSLQQRLARPFEAALEELIKMRGTQFDPAGVDVALEIAPAEWCLMKDRVEEERCEKQT
jgi:HD-GYP domain-containing protein (c-di-GMP phosphodiesterase class II)